LNVATRCFAAKSEKKVLKVRQMSAAGVRLSKNKKKRDEFHRVFFVLLSKLGLMDICGGKTFINVH